MFAKPLAITATVLCSFAGTSEASTVTADMDATLRTFSVSAELTELIFYPFLGETYGEVKIAENDPQIGDINTDFCDLQDGLYSCYSHQFSSMDVASIMRRAGTVIDGLTSLSGTISFFGNESGGCTGTLMYFLACSDENYFTEVGTFVLNRSVSVSDEGFGISSAVPISNFLTEYFSSTSLSVYGQVEFHREHFRMNTTNAKWAVTATLVPLDAPGTLPSPVPLPASLPLLAGALLAVGAIGRRRVSPR